MRMSLPELPVAVSWPAPPIRTVVSPHHPGRECGVTAMTELREVDRDELVNVEGGTSGDHGPWCGFHPPG